MHIYFSFKKNPMFSNKKKIKNWGMGGNLSGVYCPRPHLLIQYNQRQRDKSL
jgi:hypothetical protein